MIAESKAASSHQGRILVRKSVKFWNCSASTGHSQSLGHLSIYSFPSHCFIKELLHLSDWQMGFFFSTYLGWLFCPSRRHSVYFIRILHTGTCCITSESAQKGLMNLSCCTHSQLELLSLLGSFYSSEKNSSNCDFPLGVLVTASAPLVCSDWPEGNNGQRFNNFYAWVP